MNNSILFVDDEPNIIQGIRRMLFSYRNKWNLYYANGADAALEIMDERSIDIVVSDMRMPKIDGAHLLGIVRDKSPGTIRVILTGQNDKEKAVLSANLAHRCLHKPCNSEDMISNLKELLKWKKNVDEANLTEIVQQLGELPVLPKVYLELQDELNASEVSVQKIEKIISSDPVIVAKLLQLVNSSFFGLSVKITNLTQAINYIGISIIKTLVLFTKIFSIMKLNQENQLFIERVWQHSNRVANLSVHILKANNAGKSEIEQGYIAAILHDIGKAFLTQVPVEMNYNVLKDFNKSEDFIKNEVSLLGTDHTVVGSYILSLWGFDEVVLNAAKYHHNPDKFGEDILLDSIIAANVIAEKYIHDYDFLENRFKNTEIEKWKSLYEYKEDGDET